MTAWKAKIVSAAVLVILVLIWILQNRGLVQTKFLFVTVTMPQSALLAITVLAGITMGIFLAWIMSGNWNKHKNEAPAVKGE